MPPGRSVAVQQLIHQVDQIILTGGIAYTPNTEKYLKEYLGFIAPITVYPGEDELLAELQRDDVRAEEHSAEF